MVVVAIGAAEICCIFIGFVENKLESIKTGADMTANIV